MSFYGSNTIFLKKASVFMKTNLVICRDSMVPGPAIGYMPQELALYGEFTIKETLKYFGRSVSFSVAKLLNNSLVCPSDCT